MPSKVYREFESLSRLIEIDHVEYGLFCGKDWCHHSLQSPFNRLYVILDGEGSIKSDCGDYILEAGYAYLIPAEVSFDTEVVKNMKQLFVHFDLKRYCHVNILQTQRRILEMPIDVKVYNNHLQNLEANEISSYFRIKAGVTSLIYEMISQLDLVKYAQQISSMPDTIKELFELLENELTAKTRTWELAARLNISQSMLSKLFKSTTGMKLKDYIQKQLMIKAQVLLVSSGESIQEIAYTLEYKDTLYFSKVFRQWMGITPTDYRKLMAVQSIL